MVLLVFDFWFQKTLLHGSNKAGDTVAYTPVPCNKGKPQWIAFVLVSAVFVSAGPCIIFWINIQPQAEGSQGQVTLFQVLENGQRWMPMKMTGHLGIAAPSPIRGSFMIKIIVKYISIWGCTLRRGKVKS